MINQRANDNSVTPYPHPPIHLAKVMLQPSLCMLRCVPLITSFAFISGHVYPDTAHAYESSWYQTMDFYSSSLEHPSTQIRGNVPGQQSVNASTFCCGAAQLFDRPCYGSQAQAATCFPQTATSAAAVLNNAAGLIRDAFDWAVDYAGVDGAVGIEFPLKMPAPLVANKTTLLEAYTGIFGRIVASKQRISTFWLWTTEGVENHGSGKGYPQSNPLWQSLVSEIEIAQHALKLVPDANFSLGTNGWCLGPGDNASFFDKMIPDPTFKISAINGALGWLPPDPAFAQMDGSLVVTVLIPQIFPPKPKNK